MSFISIMADRLAVMADNINVVTEDDLLDYARSCYHDSINSWGALNNFRQIRRSVPSEYGRDSIVTRLSTRIENYILSMD